MQIEEQNLESETKNTNEFEWIFDEINKQRQKYQEKFKNIF